MQLHVCCAAGRTSSCLSSFVFNVAFMQLIDFQKTLEHDEKSPNLILNWAGNWCYIEVNNIKTVENMAKYFHRLESCKHLIYLQLLDFYTSHLSPTIKIYYPLSCHYATAKKKNKNTFVSMLNYNIKIFWEYISCKLKIRVTCRSFSYAQRWAWFYKYV